MTASAFVATIDDITRFRTAHELEANLGVIPSERSSGEKRQLGHVTNAGNGRKRWLLVEAPGFVDATRRSDRVGHARSGTGERRAYA